MVEQTYTFGETCILTAVPDDCCVFSHWVDDRNPCTVFSTEPVIEIPVTENMFFRALMSPKIVHVNVVLNYPDLGSTTGSGNYECGDVVTVSATTNICNTIAWHDGGQCDAETVTEDGECPDGIRTITCTFTVYEDIDIYADIEPVFYTAEATPCPIEGGHTGVIQTQTSGFIPNNNGVPCIPFSGDGTNFFGCTPVTFMAYPNSGYEFSGWVQVPYETADCIACEISPYISNDMTYTTNICEDMHMVACFRKHHLIRMFFNGCCQEMVTYAVLGSNPVNYTNPFYVIDGFSLTINVGTTDKCCKMDIITVNGVEFGNETFSFTPTVDCDIIFNSTSLCHTVTMVMTGDCISSGIMSYSGGSQFSHITYTGPIEGVEDGSEMHFYLDNETVGCCQFSKWRVYSGGQIMEYQTDELIIEDITGNITVECVVENKCHVVTMEISGSTDCGDWQLFYLVSDGNEVVDFGIYETPVYVIDGYFCGAIFGVPEGSCCSVDHWNVYIENLYYQFQTTQIGQIFTLPAQVVNSDITIECVLSFNETYSTLTIDKSGIQDMPGMFNFVIEDVTTGEFFGAFGCNDDIITKTFNACSAIKLYISTTYSNYLGNEIDTETSPNIKYIQGMFLDENNSEYTGYIHGLFSTQGQNGSYFMYDTALHSYRCITYNDAKMVNAMIIELDMSENHTIKFDFGQTTLAHSNNQSYYYNDGVSEYTETSTYQDFVCPFMENCSGVQSIQTLCV